ncbi:MAG: MarR family winged helix-turn-helix transcriptional regulator [Acidimicrobiales bacterium]
MAQVVAWLARQTEGALATVDLSLPQFRVLELLAEREALPSWLAERLDVQRPTITAVVDGMVSRGLVVRTHHPQDRRKVTHAITPEGRRALDRAEHCVERRLDAIAGTLDDDRLRAAAFDGLDQWGVALVRWRELRHDERAGQGEQAERAGKAVPLARSETT